VQAGCDIPASPGYLANWRELGMLGGFCPTIVDAKTGLPIYVSIRLFLSSDSLEELKSHAIEAALEEGKRQFIIQWGEDYVLFNEHQRSLEFFQGKRIVAQFSRSGRETHPRSPRGSYAADRDRFVEQYSRERCPKCKGLQSTKEDGQP
jgi:hypothetical protein